MLLNLLRTIWSDRQDWFWGVDMCYYYEANIEEPKKSKAIVPDGFLAIGVPRLKDEGGRLSYVLWQEQVKPILALEVISKKYNGEYDQKLTQYQELGILYYVVYNALSSRRGRYKKHGSLEVYKLINSKYELAPSVSLFPESGKVVWIPEIGLGLGCERRVYGNWDREWLYWYDRDNRRYPTAEESAEQERMIASQERMIASQERMIASQERMIASQERMVASQERMIASQERMIASQERIAKQEAEAIAEQERQQKLQERQQKEKLANYLRSLGIDPDQI